MRKYIQFLLQPPITRSFGKKLQQNFHTLTPGEMCLYLLFLRPFWSKERRFFFEGSLPLLGQLHVAERKALYDSVREHTPRQCFEIGTYTGGGSTYFLAAALAKNGTGTLYTLENSMYYFDKASSYYGKKLPKLNERTSFLFGGSAELFRDAASEFDKVDFVFFDGAEDGQQTVDQYNFFKPFFKSGSIIAFHDWNTEKTIAVKPLITNDANWELITELTPPSSIGLAIFKHK